MIIRIAGGLPPCGLGRKICAGGVWPCALPYECKIAYAIGAGIDEFFIQLENVMTIKAGDRLPDGTLSEYIETATEGCSVGPNNFQVADLAKRSEEHTSELQSLMSISYAVFC